MHLASQSSSSFIFFNMKSFSVISEPETDALSYLLPGLAEAVLDADV
jgi:hypothetical protein